MYKEYIHFEAETNESDLLITDSNNEYFLGKNINENVLVTENECEILERILKENKEKIDELNKGKKTVNSRSKVKFLKEKRKVLEEVLKEVEKNLVSHYKGDYLSDIAYITKCNKVVSFFSSSNKIDLYKPTINALRHLRDEIFEKYGYMIYYGKTEDELAKTLKK